MDEYFVMLDDARSPITLGTRIGQGGEAEIWQVPQYRGCAAKIYRDASRHQAARDKLQAMLARPPAHMNAMAAGIALPQFAWPTHLVEDAAGRLRGFLMPEVPRERSALLSRYMARTNMAAHLSLDDWSLPRRVQVCANLALTIAALHQLGHYFVDISPLNIAMFKDTGIVCLLDNDSFSIAGEGRRFAATVIAENYVAPELLRSELSPSDVSTDWQDRFALALLIFQILNNGIHPFQGVPQFETEAWDQSMCIERGLYPYGITPNPQVLPAPGSVHTSWPPSLRVMFDKAFGATRASARPMAADWRDLLNGFHGSYRVCDVCPRDVLHIHFPGMACQECLFAELAEQRRLQRAQGRPARQRMAGPLPPAPEPDRSPHAVPEPVPLAGAAVDALPQEQPGGVAALAAQQAASQRSTPRATSGAARGKWALVAAAVAGLGVLLVQMDDRNDRGGDAAVATSQVATGVVQPAAVATPPAPVFAPAPPPPAPATPAPATPAPATPAPAPQAAPAGAQDDAVREQARALDNDSDADGIAARLQIIRTAVAAAARLNQADLARILKSGMADDDNRTVADAQALMREVDFIGAYADWTPTRGLGRKIGDAVRNSYRGDPAGAVAAQWRALALAPVDREVAANLAYYLALDRRSEALAVSIYALSLPRPADATGTSAAWQMLAVALAQAGRAGDSEAAFQVGLAITPRLTAFCRNLLQHQRDFGPMLNGPVTAVFQRIRARGQSDAQYCGYPPQWLS